MSVAERIGWDRLRHGGLLLDPQRLSVLEEHLPPELSWHTDRELRRRISLALSGADDAADFVAFVLQDVCGFGPDTGTWLRGSHVPTEWTRRGIAGEAIRPRMVWTGAGGGVLPVFIDNEARVGVGRGRKAVSHVLQWLRAGEERLALLTNGRQWRLVFAGLDFNAWCEWDVDLWLEEGELSAQVTALRTLLAPALWTPPEGGGNPPLLQAILDSRKGQAELSAVLGERVREAVELLVQAHGDALKERCGDVDPADIYRAAVRVVMRMVVVLFAEARDLLPRENPLYHGSYGLGGLLEELEKVAARGGNRLARSWNAWPRVLALFRLVYEGSHHPELPVRRYGGELFAPGAGNSEDGLTRALAVFETACFDGEVMPDRDVHRVLDRITRTRVRIRQGHSSTWMPAPVDFSDLSSEYIGILYEGLLDFELRSAPAGDPVIFLAVGKQPALPLSRLESMEDAAVANLFEKLKDTSSKADSGEEADEEGTEDGDDVAAELEDEAEAAAAQDEEEDAEPEPDEPEDVGDERHVTRTRAEEWARRAVAVGRLVAAPGANASPQERQAYESAVAAKARRLVARVVLPGEWYLVRWGGTRKGSGTFYTRPALAVPTVQRTLRPLAYDPPVDGAGTPDRLAPPARWTPKKPEEILALKVCDPACGSGTFPVAALRFLTDALYASLHAHGRIGKDGDQALVRLLEGTSPAGNVPEERLGHELIPCPPESELFEPRLKARLRRYVVERCIYGVDLDPLAVELCRLALWIETMDRELPFSFLDHKIKCGNSLVGAWFDQFQHYPVMAWKNREGGDKNHGNGVHFEKNARTKAIKDFVRQQLTPDLKELLTGQLDLLVTRVGREAEAVHDDALALLSRLHDLPIHESAERARAYREELLGSEAYRNMRRAMDRWCACWFWPTESLDLAPLPSSIGAAGHETDRVVEQVAARQGFFHWELEFPDVFSSRASGFDAILGNPPWDIAKPNSKEFFSSIDPLYRTYGKQEALDYQKSYFQDREVEQRWLDYNADFRAQSNYVSYAASPFGDPDENENSKDRFSIARGNANHELHRRWRTARAKSHGYSGPTHPYRHQGSADLNLYKLFLERAYSLLCDGGRLGFIVPSGLYSDHGTGALRELFLQRCQWEWLFGFENREKIFDIHRSFKFNPIIVQKGGSTEAIHTAFMRRRLEDWEHAEAFATPYTLAQVQRFSPENSAFLEIGSPDEAEILELIYRNGRPGASADLAERALRFAKGDFDMVTDSRLFSARDRDTRGDRLSCWRTSEGERLLPLYEGRMIGAFDPSQKGWVRGRGRAAIWRSIDISEGVVEPQWLIHETDYERRRRGLDDPRVGFIRVTSNTNTRTMHACLLPPFPSGFTVGQLQPLEKSWRGALELVAVLNSFVFDFVVRRRVVGLDIAWFHLRELPLPTSPLLRAPAVLYHIARLSLTLPAHCVARICLYAEGVIPSDLKPAIAHAERLRLRCMLEAAVAVCFGIGSDDLRAILEGCDHPAGFAPACASDEVRLAKAFWRVEASTDPELRLPVLSLVALRDLEALISSFGGDRARGLDLFLTQNGGQGWLLPETLRLADFNLGHDARAEHPQPVASRLRAQSVVSESDAHFELSWQECHANARELLGEERYRRLLEELGSQPVPAGVALESEAAHGEQSLHRPVSQPELGLFD